MRIFWESRRRVRTTAAMTTVIVCAAALSACGDDNNNSNASTSAADEAASTTTAAASPASGADGEKVDLAKKRVGILNVNGSDPGAILLQESAADAAKTLGWTTFAVDAGGDPSKMAAGMTQIVNQKPDAILLDAVDPAAVGAGLTAAGKAKIPVIVYGGAGSPNPNVSATVAPNDFTLGSLASEYMIRRIGTRGKVAIMTTDGIPFAGDRTRTLKLMLRAYPGIKVVATHQVDYAKYQQDTLTATRSILQANPDLDAIYSTISAYPAPISTALSQAGNEKTFVVSFYAYGPYLKLIRDGKIAAAANAPLQQSGYGAIDLLAQFFGKNTPITATAPFGQLGQQYNVITKDNADLAETPTVDYAKTYTEKWASQFSNVER